MPITQTDVNLTNVILTALPGIIGLIKGMHGVSAPAGTPPPTDAEVLAALLQAGLASISIDEAWKSSHPA